MDYILYLRGINVGGKHKVTMAVLKEELAELGFTNVESYINSGNLLFSSQESQANIVQLLTDLFEKNYDFPLPISLLSTKQFLEEVLPDWWKRI